MPSYTLTDSANNRWEESFQLTPNDAGLALSPAWSVTKSRLHGGRRDGVDLIHVDNGVLAFDVIPTRGMNLWKARLGSLALGWNSPVKDGPVNPAFVDANAWGGLGWLDGFDELLARCGLDSFGPPYEEAGRTYTLHGRISNIPAHFVALHAEEGKITVEGHVHETRMFQTSLRMVTKITTAPGSTTLTVRDEFTNLRDVPSDLQVLYHWNFGEPLMEEGSQFVAPVKTLVPRDRAATEGLSGFDVYGGPVPGSAEQVYLMELAGEASTGQTIALLKNREGTAGVALRYSVNDLPAFSLWKAQGGRNDGYVTGLEPATGFPNPKPYERSRKRVVTLAPSETHVAEVTLQVCEDARAVERVEAMVREIQAKTVRVVHPKPVEPFASEG